MKTWFYLLFYFVSVAAFSQNDSLIIQTKDLDTIKSNWIELKSYPFFQKPFVRIDSEIGKEISLDRIDFIRGSDQNKNFRILKVFPIESEIQYTQWKHIENKSGQLTIYQDQMIFGLRNDFPKEIVKEYYSHNSANLKKLNFENVKHDLRIIKVNNNEIRSTKALIIIQRVSQLIGVTLLADLIIDNTSNVSAEFMKNPNSDQFYLSACLVLAPISLNSLKKKLLRQSLYSAFGN